MASASVPHSTEHSQMVHPGANSASNPLRVGETVSPWTRYQERARRQSACAEQPSVGGTHVGKSIPCVIAQSVPRYDETSNDEHYQPGFQAQPYYGTHEPGLAHPDITRDARSSYHSMTGTRHLPGLRLLPCLGEESLAFHNHTLWTVGLSDLIPKCFGSNARLPR